MYTPPSLAAIDCLLSGNETVPSGEHGENDDVAGSSFPVGVFRSSNPLVCNLFYHLTGRSWPGPLHFVYVQLASAIEPSNNTGGGGG